VAQELHRMQRYIRKYQYLLSCFNSRNDLGPRTEAQVPSRIGRRSVPLGQRGLVREPYEQRILNPRIKLTVATKRDDVPITVRNQNLFSYDRSSVSTC